MAIIGEYADDDITDKLIIPNLVQSFKKKESSTPTQTPSTQTGPRKDSEQDEEIRKIELELKTLLREDGSPFEFLKKRMKGIKIHAPAIYFDEGKYLVNHTKKQFISRSNFRAPLAGALNAMVSCMQDKVGKWSGDSLSITIDIDKYKGLGYSDATEMATRTYVQLLKENHNSDDHDF